MKQTVRTLENMGWRNIISCKLVDEMTNKWSYGGEVYVFMVCNGLLSVKCILI